jgi:SAM-dependent methyltransferase
MSQWEERVNRESNPARRLEHELRYSLVAPLVREAPLWVDLGCGSGVAAADGLGSGVAARVLLVDLSDDALEQAAREFKAFDATTRSIDLGTVEGAEAVREAIVGEQGGVVTCFETLAYLENFVPCVDLLIELGTAHTVVLSVPNDAFWAIENPFHRTSWGEGAFEELRRLLPATYVQLEQVPLAASAIAGPGAAELDLASARLEAERVPSHFLLAFGPHAERLAPVAATRMADAVEERRWERERTSELAFLAARLQELESAS